MTQSSIAQTKQGITALHNYGIDCNDHEFQKFQFGYLEFDDFIASDIFQFICKLNNGTQEQERQYFELRTGITLIDTDFIYNAVQDKRSGFEQIKLDSLNFCVQQPDFPTSSIYHLKGGVTCHSEFFTIDAERIPDGLQYPTIIYKSPRFSYSKLDNLLQNQ